MNFDHFPRHLFGALLISLLLHLLLVFGWGWSRPLPPAAQQAMQVVVSAKSVVQPAANAPAVAPKAPASTPKHPGGPSSPPVLAQEKSPSSGEAVLAAPPAPSAGQAARDVPASAPAEAGKAGVAVDGVSADGLRQYRIDLAGAARRFRHYPAVARARGWEGVAEVSIAVNAGLPSPALRLVRTSGHEILDEQALEMLSRAVATTPLPESLRGRSFVVPMPIRFSLEE